MSSALIGQEGPRLSNLPVLRGTRWGRPCPCFPAQDLPANFSSVLDSRQGLPSSVEWCLETLIQVPSALGASQVPLFGVLW